MSPSFNVRSTSVSTTFILSSFTHPFGYEASITVLHLTTFLPADAIVPRLQELAQLHNTNLTSSYVAEEYNGSFSADQLDGNDQTRTSILFVQISVFLFPYPFPEDQRSWAGAKVVKLAAHCRRCMLHACMHAADPHEEICNCFKWKNSATTKTFLDSTWTYPEATSQNSSSSLNSLMCTTSSTEIVQTAIMPSCQLHAHCMLLASSHDRLQLQQKQKKIFSKKLFNNICFPLISW